MLCQSQINAQWESTYSILHAPSESIKCPAGVRENALKQTDSDGVVEKKVALLEQTSPKRMPLAEIFEYVDSCRAFDWLFKMETKFKCSIRVNKPPHGGQHIWLKCLPDWSQLNAPPESAYSNLCALSESIECPAGVNRFNFTCTIRVNQMPWYYVMVGEMLMNTLIKRAASCKPAGFTFTISHGRAFLISCFVNGA